MLYLLHKFGALVRLDLVLVPFLFSIFGAIFVETFGALIRLDLVIGAIFVATFGTSNLFFGTSNLFLILGS